MHRTWAHDAVTLSGVLADCTGPRLGCWHRWRLPIRTGTGGGPALFEHQTGMALGIVGTGSSIGCIVYAVVFINLIDRVGFAWTVRTLSFVAVGSRLPIPFILRKGSALMRQSQSPSENSSKTLISSLYVQTTHPGHARVPASEIVQSA